MINRKKSKAVIPRDKLLSKFTIFFFDLPKTTALLWAALVIFGGFSYTTLLKREGFPSVNIPISIVSGTYFVNDPAKVDTEVTKPVTDLALENKDAKVVRGSSTDNFFVVQIQYKDGTDANAATKELEEKVKSSEKVSDSTQIQYSVPHFGATGPDTKQVDAAVSFFSLDESVTATALTAKAEEAAVWLREKNIAGVKEVFVKSPFDSVVDPTTGQQVTVQRSFDRFGHRHDSHTEFFNSVLIGFTKTNGIDLIKFDNDVHSALEDLKNQPQFKDYSGEVSASFAPQIKENLSELQRVLLEGLIAVLIVGSIVIAIRASLITVVSMITVVVATLGFLFAIGYTLNVITLFALILGLSLIVDDTIIMVEAIDSARKREKDPRKAVKEATRKISRAMVAATATASLSFAPLIFVGGILGSFIRAIPITIIASLVISLLVALVFIPLFARFVLLGKKQMGAKNVKEIAAGFEARIAAFVARPMLWARNSTKRLFFVGSLAILIGFGFLAGGIFIAKDLVFNIFPPTKDTNALALSISYPQNTNVQKAQEIAKQVDEIAAEELGENFVHSSYYGSGSAQTATPFIEITSYSKREVTSPQLVEKLQKRFDNFKEAKIAVAQSDLGPPSASFIIQVDATNREAAFKVADDLLSFLNSKELKRVSGKVAHFTNARVSSPDEYGRYNGEPIITVSTGFDGDDTTTLVTLAQDAVEKEFTGEKLSQYGLSEDAISFDLGQESENQESFQSLALAFPVLLAGMFVLLAIQFRSFLQPLLIFMAIPFSIFGVMFGLRVTDNAISFFAMLGFFALIGLSIKNTILLTDFANQARRSGLSAIDAAVAALEERFRPLFATSMTAVVSLIPLAIASPFWQGLAVVLIFGLLSNTLLVITVFPYYYLGAEYLRLHISAKDFFIWLAITVVAVVAVSKVSNPTVGFLMIPTSILLVILQNFYRKRFLKRA